MLDGNAKTLGLWSSKQSNEGLVKHQMSKENSMWNESTWRRCVYNSSTFKTWKQQWSPKEVPAQSKSRVVKRKILSVWTDLFFFHHLWFVWWPSPFWLLEIHRATESCCRRSSTVGYPTILGPEKLKSWLMKPRVNHFVMPWFGTINCYINHQNQYKPI